MTVPVQAPFAAGFGLWQRLSNRTTIRWDSTSTVPPVSTNLR